MLVKGHGEAPVLRKPELDAFLATAMSPELRNVTYLAEMRLEMVTIRGVHLAAIFMQVLFFSSFFLFFLHSCNCFVHCPKTGNRPLEWKI